MTCVVFIDRSISVCESLVDGLSRLQVLTRLEEIGTVMKTNIGLETLLTEIDAAELFGRPLGPYDSCFSTNQIVRMFESGARPDELQHMFTCSACNDLVSRSSRLGRMLEVEDSPTQGEGLGKTIRELFLRDKASPPPNISVVLGLADPVLEVRDPGRAVSMTIELLPCVEPQVMSLDVSTLRLAGAATSKSATLEPGDLGTGRMHRVTFREARLSKAVRQSLSRHNRVADQISVSGVLRGATEEMFLGKAKIEFVQS